MSRDDKKSSYLQNAISKSGYKDGQFIISDGIEIQVKIEFVDMNTEKQQYALQEAENAYHRARKQMQESKGDLMYYKDIAKQLKLQFDEKFEGTWHVTVGKNFGSYFTYESKNVILVWINDLGFLIFKWG